MSPWQVFVLVLWGIFIVAGYYLGKRKGRTADGVWLAIILGPIGLAITTFGLRPRRPEPAPAEPANESLTGVGSIQPQADVNSAQTDSWIWR
jgi:ABC-type transport system involved in cytochrome c biogenesis permease subunit